MKDRENRLISNSLNIVPKISSNLVQLEHCQNQILLNTVIMRVVAEYSLSSMMKFKTGNIQITSSKKCGACACLFQTQSWDVWLVRMLHLSTNRKSNHLQHWLRLVHSCGVRHPRLSCYYYNVISVIRGTDIAAIWQKGYLSPNWKKWKTCSLLLQHKKKIWSTMKLFHISCLWERPTLSGLVENNYFHFARKKKNYFHVHNQSG